MLNIPSPTGEYAVGTFTFTATTDRAEILAPGTKRLVPARVYYPVTKESVEGMSRARYTFISCHWPSATSFGRFQRR